MVNSILLILGRPTKIYNTSGIIRHVQQEWSEEHERVKCEEKMVHYYRQVNSISNISCYHPDGLRSTSITVSTAH